MLDRAKVLAVVDAAYEARNRGDKAALDTMWVPGAKFRLAGDESLLRDVPAGLSDARDATGELIDLFKFDKLERMDAVVEGNRAAIHWRVTLTPLGGPTVVTELYDLWTLDDNGKVQSLLQFCDTGLIAQLAKRAKSM